MKELILDYAKWRCGGDCMSEHVIGIGRTMLHNPEGFECCLGQFALQLKPNLTINHIFNKLEPGDIRKEIPLLTIDKSEEGWKYYQDTDLTGKAIAINDDPSTTPEQKITELKTLFASEGYSIKVINQPA